MDAHEVLEHYLTSLEDYDLDATLACFTEDVFYSHPPYPTESANAPRHEVTDREQLAELFRLRGKRSAHHRIELVIGDGSECLAAGVVEHDGMIAASFVSRFTLTDDGRISRYAAYASSPAVGATVS